MTWWVSALKEKEKKTGNDVIRIPINRYGEQENDTVSEKAQTVLISTAAEMGHSTRKTVQISQGSGTDVY